ncbi:MAG: glycosyltransferase [Mesorhizobium sp.]|nr:MAG: glycosyltransferase [Mesorhizobium sp.]
MRTDKGVIHSAQSVVCLVTPSFHKLGLKMGLAERLAARSIALRVVPAADVAANGGAAVLTCGRDDPEHGDMLAAAAAAHLPTISVSSSWISGRHRLSEYLPSGRQGEDCRLRRLVSAFGSTLGVDAVGALVASLPLTGNPVETATLTTFGNVVVNELPLSWLPAETRPLPVPSDEMEGAAEQPPVALISGPSITAFAALAAGVELIVVGENCFAGLGLTHDVSKPSDLPGAFASVSGSPRNRRDDARRTLALEALLNALPNHADALAAALDEAVTALGRAPRRSVSIVINNYNYGSYLGDAIATSLNQTVSAREVIVVDDGSTDCSREMINATPGIVSVFKANGGQASALNEGFKHATGDIVLFLDADDLLLPNLVEQIGKASLRGVSRLQFGLETVDQAGRPIGLYAPDGRDSEGWLCGALAARGIFPFMPTSGNAFPREILEAVLPIPEQDWRLCADLYLVIACATLGETVDLDEVLGQYRVHDRNGYFRVLGAEPNLLPKLQVQRARAWRGVLPKLAQFMPSPLAERCRLGLRRLLLQVALESPDRSVTRIMKDVAGGIGDALTSRTMSFGDRLRHAIESSRLVIGGQAAGAHSIAALKPELIDLVYAAGPAKWPRLSPGERVTFATSPNARRIVGGGWSLGEISGLRPEAPEAFLAFRLPEIAANWRARFEFEISGDAPVRGIEVRLNGVAIDDFNLHRTGSMEFTLPQELLLRWTPIGSGPGAYAACLSMRVPPAQAERVCFRLLEISLLPAAPPVAPRIPVSHEVLFSRKRSHASWPPEFSRADGMLVNGWDWPDRHGVAMAGAHATLALSVHERAPYSLCLCLADDVGSPLVNVLQVVVNGVMMEIHEAPDGRSFSVMVSQDIAGISGRLKVELWLGADPGTGRWPFLRLASLRVDALTYGHGGTVLSPNIRHDAGPYADGPGRDARGLIPDGKVALLAPGNFRLGIPVPAGFGPARLALYLTMRAAHTEPVMAKLSVGGGTCLYWLGSDNLLTVDLPEGEACPVLEGRLEGDWPFTLGSVQLFRPASPAIQPDEGTSEAAASFFDAGTLSRFTVASSDWYPVLDSALWFAVHRTSLKLPPLPQDSQFLDVAVLTQLRPRQHLRLMCGDASAETQIGGLETLRLPIVPSDAKRGPLLTIEVDAVVAAIAVGASSPGMLGGAICAVEVVRHAGRSRVAARYGRSSGDNARRKLVDQEK